MEASVLLRTCVPYVVHVHRKNTPIKKHKKSKQLVCVNYTVINNFLPRFPREYNTWKVQETGELLHVRVIYM